MPAAPLPVFDILAGLDDALKVEGTVRDPLSAGFALHDNAEAFPKPVRVIPDALNHPETPILL
jgi:hypothetical protein